MVLKRAVVLFFVLGLVQVVSVNAFAQTVLNFPRVISNSTLFSGLAVGNPTAASASVTFTAFLPDGTLYAPTGGQNPATLQIPAGGQAAKVFSDLFGSGAFNGWIQATSSTAGLTGFFLNGNTALTDLDGAGAITPAAQFTLPFASEDSVAQTEITVVNVNANAASPALTLYGLDGSIIATKVLSLPSRSLVRQTLTGIFGSLDFSNASHVGVTSDLPVIGHDVVANYALAGSPVRRETAALSGQQVTAATRYILPEFATGGGWLSLIGIVNASGVGQQVTLTAYQNDGTVANVPHNPVTIPLNGNAALRTTVDQLFGFSSSSMITGWIQVQASLGYVSSYICYGNTGAPSFAAVAGTDASSGSQFEVFSQVAQGDGFYTGLTLVNPGTQPANVQFYTLRADGTTVGQSSFTVQPNQRVGSLFNQILPASLTQVGGWAFLRSSQPVVSAVLFGTINGDALANVPQQIPAGDFTPAPQTTAAIDGTVLAGGQPIGNVKITLSGPVTASTTTDSSGNYIFSQLPAGAYVVTAVQSGAQFVPVQQTVNVAQQNMDGVNFQAGGLTAAGAPSIQFVSPTAAFTGTSALSIRVFGSNFTPVSVIQLNGQALATAFVSSVEVDGVIPAAQLTTAGTLQVTVLTPPPGGGVSGAAPFTVNAAPSNPLIIQGSLPVGSSPSGVAIDTTHNTALITNQSGDSVTVLDLTTFATKTTIGVGRSPADGIAILPSKNIALVANPGSNSVSVIDLATNTKTQDITAGIGSFPVGLAVNPTTNQAVVTNANDNNVSIIDLNSLTVIGQIGVDTTPEGVAINPKTNQAVVTNSGSNSAWIIDLGSKSILAKIPVGQFPRGVAINSTTNVAVVVNANSNDLTIIDLAQRSVISKSLAVGTGPTDVAIHELTNLALVTNSGVPSGSTSPNFGIAGTVSVVDLGALTTMPSIGVGSAAFGIAVDQGNQEGVVANFGTGSVTVIRIPNPIPHVGSVSPATFPAGGADFTLTITGTGFVPTSVVTLNGHLLPTTYVSATQLQAVVTSAVQQQLLQVQSSSSVANATTSRLADTTPLTLTIGVSNPGPGGGSSPPPANPNGTQLTPQNAQPVLSSISPLQASVGSGPLALTLSGNNFNATSIISFGGSQFSPSSSSETSMTVNIPAIALVAGTYPVAVTNPAPGGGVSSAFLFTVNAQSNPAPIVASVSPTTVPAGSGPATVTVQGGNFIGSTTATLGSAHGVVSGNSITFSLSASDTQNPGTLSGLISNPAPGGGSATFSISVLNVVPTVTGFNPMSATVGSSALPIQVTGTNFRSDSQIIIAGTPITTQFSSDTQLNGTIPASFLAQLGNVHIGVKNAPPGGGFADGGVFTIGNPLPSISSLSPASALLNQSNQQITIQGQGFVAASQVKVGGAPVGSSLVNGTLTFTLPNQTSGTSIQVQVVNPAPGGGTASATLRLISTAPVVSGISPSTGTAGTTIDLSVTGTNFVSGATINFGGSSIGTQFLGSTALAGAVTLGSPGTVSVGVTNPDGTASNTSSFTITAPVVVTNPPPPPNNPAPSISSLSPASVTAGSATFPMTIFGSNFISGSTVTFGTTSLTASSQTSASLTVSVPASAVTTAGNITVTVSNPAPGGGSATGTFNVLAPAGPGPTALTLLPSPAFVAFGGSTTVTVSVDLAPSIPLSVALSFGGTNGSFSPGLSSTSTTVSIAPGTTSTSTQIYGFSTGTTTLMASASGLSSASITVNVIDSEGSFTVSPSPITVFAGSSTTIAITRPANTVGAPLTIGLSAAPASQLSVPASLTFPANSATITTSITGLAAGTSSIECGDEDTTGTACLIVAGPQAPSLLTGRVINFVPAAASAPSTVPFQTFGSGSTVVSFGGAVTGGFQVGGCTDDCSQPVNIPFPFPFYGRNYAATYVGTNGYLTFGAPDETFDFTGEQEFLVSLPRIAAIATDLLEVQDGSTPSRIFTNTVPLANGHQALAIVYQNIGVCCDSNTGAQDSFQIVLFDTGAVQLNYQSVSNATPDTTSDFFVGISPGFPSFNRPGGVWTDGTSTYVADTSDQTIRQITNATGQVVTIAGQPASPGSMDGTGSSALFSNPAGIWGDGAGNLYITDSGNNAIRKLVISSGVVSTLVPPTAGLNAPKGIWGDGAGNLYVADHGNSTIRKVVISTGTVTTLAGSGNELASDGAGTSASFNGPNGIWGDGAGNLYVADTHNDTIRKIVISGAQVTTLAGVAGTPGLVNSGAGAPEFDTPVGIWGDGHGNLFVSEDSDNDDIRKIVIASQSVSTFAGAADGGSTDGTGTAASFLTPGLIFGDAANIYIPDSDNNVIRKAVISSAAVSTLAGSKDFFDNADAFSIDGIGTPVPNPQQTILGNLNTIPNSFIFQDFNPNFPTGAANVPVTVVPSAVPTLTAITPSFGNQGTSVDVTLTGTNFVTGVTTLAISGTGVTATSVNVSSGSSMTATLIIDAGAASGSYGITVNTAGLISGSVMFTVNSPVPALSGINPSSGSQGTSVPVTLTGTNLVSGATTVLISGTGATAASVNVTSSTTLSATFTVDSTAAPGPRNVTVTTPFGNSGTVTFTVNAPPTLASITPSFGIQGTSVPVVLSGSNFVPGASVFTFSGTGVTVTSVVVSSTVSATATLVISAGAAPGSRGVTVNTAAGTSGPATFIVTTASPLTVAGFTEFPVPTSSSAPFGITTGPDGNLWFTEAIGNNVGRITTAGIVTEFPIPTISSEPVGIATGADGSLWFAEFNGNKIGRITTAGVVTEFSIPTSGGTPVGITAGPDGNLWFTEVNGNKIGRITTAGVITEFAIPTNPASPEGIAMGPDGNLWFTEVNGNKIGRITTAGVISEFAVPTSTSEPFLIATGADGNLWFAEASGNKIGRITTAGIVTEFSIPTPSSVSEVIAAGPDGNLWFTEASGNKIGQITTAGIITEFSVPTASSIPNGITTGPDGSIWFTERTGNKIGRANLGPLPGPTLTSITPASGIQGTSVAVVLSGTNFATGATALTVSGTGVTATSVGVSNGTSMSATFVIDPAAEPGARSVTVNTAAGTSGSVTFTINLPVPTLASITPASGIQGTSVAVVLSGTNFATGATALTVSGTGVTATSVGVSNGTSMSATFVIDPAAAVGARVITVSTAGGTSGSVTFTINSSAPMLTGISPTHAPPGSAGAMMLTGSNFIPGSTVTFSGSGIQVLSTQVVNSTSIIAQIAMDAVSGTRSVAVSNGPGLTSGSQTFTVDLSSLDATTLFSTSTVAGIPGTPGTADGGLGVNRLSNPHGLWGDTQGNIVFADKGSNLIRSLNLASSTVTTLAGMANVPGAANGDGNAATFNGPIGVWSDGINAYVADSINGQIRVVTLDSGAPVSTLATGLNSPTGLWGDGQNLYVADKGDSTIKKVTLADGTVTVFAGISGAPGSSDGTGAGASFSAPHGIWGDGTYLYVADSGNNEIRRIQISNQLVTTLAGSTTGGAVDGTGPSASFQLPTGIWGDGSFLYVADQSNDTIRRVDTSSGNVVTIAGLAGSTGITDGQGNSARFTGPHSIWGDGSVLYVSDTGNSTIRMLAPISQNIDVTWTGATSTDWNTASNWSPAAVPTAVQTVYIPSAPEGQPEVSANAAVGAVYMDSGARVLIDSGVALTVSGNVKAGNIVGPGQLIMNGSAGQISGTVANLFVTGTVVASAAPIQILANLLHSGVVIPNPILTVTGNLNVQSGAFRFPGQTVTVGGNFATTSTGQLMMTTSSDALKINGNVTFNGGSTTGLLTNGTLSVGGNFTQGPTTSFDSAFAASGGHRVKFVGTSRQTVTFEEPGPGDSHFQDIEVATGSGGDVSITGTVFASGNLSLSASTSTLDGSGTLTAGALTMNAAGGVINVGNLVLAGPGNSIFVGNFGGNVSILGGTATMTGLASVSGNLTVIGSSSLDTAGSILTVQGNFVVSGNAIFKMTSGSSGLAVAGNAAIAGGDTTNYLTAGTYNIAGTFNINTNAKIGGTFSHDVIILGSVSLTANTIVNGNLTIGSILGSGGCLDVAGFNLQVGAGLTTANTGFLKMASGSPAVIVGGDALFAGGDTTGQLTNGALVVGGSFTQNTNANAFVASGTFLTQLTSTSAVYSPSFPATISFQNPASSHFATLELEGTHSPFSLLTNVLAAGQLVSSNGTTTILGNGNLLQVSGLAVSTTTGAYVMDHVIFSSIGGATTGFDHVTFQNYAATDTQFTFQQAGGQYTFDSLTFLTHPDGGFYMNVSSSNGTALTLTLTGTNLNTNASSQIQTDSNSTVILPVAAPTVASVSPSTGSQGTSVPVVLTGSNFAPGATVFTVSGTGVTVTSVVVSSGTSATATFVISAGAAPGSRGVTVNTAGGTSGPATFIVTASSPLVVTGFTEFPIPTSTSGPITIATGPDGNLWFTEGSANKIGRITTAGVLAEFSIPTNGTQPFGIATGPDGNLWFTEEFGNKIGRITPTGVVTEFSVLTNSSEPSGIAAGPDGNLWFTEFDGNKIGRITTSGVVTEFPILTGGNPELITIGPDGNLWFTEFSGNKIGRITTAGAVTEFSVPTSFSDLSGIATGPDGNLWFTELNGNMIGRITTAGVVTEFSVPTSSSEPGLIAAGPDGNLWFTEFSENKIGQITTAGIITEFSVPTGSSTPSGITAGPDGSVWFTERTGNKIGKVNLGPLAPPTLTSITPASGTQGTGVPVVLTGTNFVQGATALTVSGTGVTVTSVAVSSGTAMSATLIIDPAAATGNRNVTVSTAAGTSGSVTFTINLPAPTLGSITPASGIQGTSVPVVLTGTNFVPGATTLTVSGTGVTVTSVAVSSGTAMSATLIINPAAATGNRGVTVSTAAGTSGSVTFTINLPPPTLASITPASGIQGTSVPVVLTGTNFAPGATALTVSGTGVTVTSVVVSSGTSATATFVISAGAAPGSRGVTVNTPGGTSGPAMFIVTSSSPLTVTGFTEFPIPTSGSDPQAIAAGPDGNLWFTEVTGNKIGRIATAGVISEFPVPTSGSNPLGIATGPDGNLWFTELNGNKIGRITTAGIITEFPVPTSSSTPIEIATGPDGNLWFTEVAGNKIGRITTAGVITEFPVPTGGSSPTGIATGPDGNLWFTEDIGNKIGRITTAGVITEFPVPTSVSNSIEIGAGPDGNLWFTEENGNKIGRITTAGVITEFPVPTGSSAPVGIATGPDGNLWFTEAVGNNIGRANLGPLPAPALTSITPASGSQGTSVPVVLTGTNFVPGATTLTVSGTGVTVTSVAVSSGTAMSATLIINPAAATGNRGVTVSTTAGTSGSVTFTINLPPPTLASITPASGIQGTSVPVVLTGTNFVPGATALTVSGTGVTVTSVSVSSGTAMSATLIINPAAATGNRGVTVSTAAGTSGSVTFTINLPVPALVSITPASGTQATSVSVVLAGTNFAPGATALTVSGTGVTGTSVVVSSATSMSATFIIDPAAAIGTRGVTVTTAGGTSNSVTFTVAPAGSLSVGSGDLGGGTRVVISRPGANFTPGPATVTFGTTVAPGAVVLNSTQIAAFTPPHGAGAVNVTFGPSGGSPQTLSNAFTFSSTTIGHGFMPGPQLNTGREFTSATLLSDGRVIAIGGRYESALQSTEIADSSLAAFTAGPSLTTARYHHTATALADGRVLVVGGEDENFDANATTEILNAAGTSFSAGPSLNTARMNQTATLLADGRVLVAGGSTDEEGFEPIATAEIFDPVAGTWTSINMTSPRVFHQSVLMTDGRVLVVGGSPDGFNATSSAEIFDPSTNKFAAVPTGMNEERRAPAATLLADGRVFVAGGIDSSFNISNTAEVFDGATFAYTTDSSHNQTFIPDANCNDGECGIDSPVTAILSDGSVLMAGGDGCGDDCPTDVAILFNPGTGTFTDVSSLSQARLRPAGVRMPNGSVFIIGSDEEDQPIFASTDIFGASLSIETAQDGTGTVVGTQTINSGNSVTMYSILRSPSGAFVGNVQATWSLINKTGGVNDQDLRVNESQRNAMFIGNQAGTARVSVQSGGATGNTGVLTVHVP